MLEEAEVRMGGRAPRREPDEEAAPPLMLLEALTLAVETLRESGGGGQALEAARLLDKKAMKLRARQNRTVRWAQHCFCGHGRRDDAMICDPCFRAIPARMLLAFHYTKLGETKAALEDIRDFCKLRGRERRAA